MPNIFDYQDFYTDVFITMKRMKGDLVTIKCRRLTINLFYYIRQ
jgi:hypothetical protein